MRNDGSVIVSELKSMPVAVIPHVQAYRRGNDFMEYRSKIGVASGALCGQTSGHADGSETPSRQIPYIRSFRHLKMHCGCTAERHTY